jgi:hypothetical protein
MGITHRPDASRVGGISPGTREDKLIQALSVGFLEAERHHENRGNDRSLVHGRDQNRTYQLHATSSGILGAIDKRRSGRHLIRDECRRLNIDRHFFGLTQLLSCFVLWREKVNGIHEISLAPYILQSH